MIQLRSRKLLLHKKQISTLIGQTKEQGFAIVPIEDVFERWLCKSIDWRW